MSNSLVAHTGARPVAHTCARFQGASVGLRKALAVWCPISARFWQRWESTLLVAFLLVLPAHAQPRGESKVECASLHSHILNHDVPYCVMLPPSYGTDAQRRFPVAYYLHGLGDNEQSLVNLGGWSIYDRLQREKKIGEFVVAAPAGGYSFYLNSRDGRFRYEDFFLQEFIPAMEKKYRIGTTRAQRGIMGISMGGFGALHYAFKYPERFAAVSANMPALIEQLPREFSQDWQRMLMGAILGDPPDTAYYERNSPFTLARKDSVAELNRMEIYLDCGAGDRYGFYHGSEAMDRLLTRRGVRHEAHIYPGGHDWSFVTEHLAASLQAQSRGLGASTRREPERPAGRVPGS